MTRELTNGFPLAAHIPEGFIDRIFAKAFLRLLPTLARTLGDRTLNVWFDVPRARIAPSSNELENLIDIEIPLTARLSDRSDESSAVFRARVNLIQVQVDRDGVTLIAPMLDFNAAAPGAFTVEAEVDDYREPVLTALSDALRQISPFTAAPLFPSGDRQFFLRTYAKAAGTSRANLLAIFLTGESNVPPIPPTVVAHAAGIHELRVLVPRDVIDAQIAIGLAASGLGTLPAVIPGTDGITLLSLSTDLRDGFIFMSGVVRGDIVLGLTTDAAFGAWVLLSVSDDTVQVVVARTKHDGDPLFDVLDLFGAGVLTRTLEAALPAAISSVGSGAFGSLALFARDVPIERAFAAVRAYGDVGITPGGLTIPVTLTDTSRAAAVSPPYLRGNPLSREFHVAGCKFGDLIKLRRRFPTWRAAIAAGYNGCFTCQRDYNVAGAGVLRINVIGRPSNAVPVPSPMYELVYTGQAQRFGVPISVLKEESKRGMRGRLRDDGELVYSDVMDFLVPGPWTLRLEWDGWTVTGEVDVRKRWVDAQGHTQGQATSVTVTKGDPALTVTHT